MADAIFFDLYETLITELDPNWKPQPSLAERLGIDEETCLSVWKAKYRDSMVSAISDFRCILREIYDEADKQVDENLIEQLYLERLASKAMPFSRIEDSVIDVLCKIRDKKIKLGLISNARPEEAAAWQESRLSSLFDSVVFSFEAGSLKPEPQIYHIGCDRLNVTPNASLFVGDGGSDELTGAAGVGMSPYWATWFIDRWPSWKRADRTQSKAYPRLRSVEELIGLVAQEGKHVG